MSKQRKDSKSKAIHERAARGETPPAAGSKSRMEIWRPGYVAETPGIADEEISEASPAKKGRRAVRAVIRPTSKYEGGE